MSKDQAKPVQVSKAEEATIRTVGITKTMSKEETDHVLSLFKKAPRGFIANITPTEVKVTTPGE